MAVTVSGLGERFPVRFRQAAGPWLLDGRLELLGDQLHQRRVARLLLDLLGPHGVVLARRYLTTNFYIFFNDFHVFSGETSNLKNYNLLEASNTQLFVKM